MQEIVVLSGKGGTGKTSITAALATIGKNLLAVDCDVDAANLYLLLNPQNYREEKYTSGKTAFVHADVCTVCGKCVDACRFEAIRYFNDSIEVQETACEGCQLCATICPAHAIEMIPRDKSRCYEAMYNNGYMVYARLFPGEENSGKLVSVIREKAKALAQKHQLDTILLDGPPGVGCPVISSVTGTQKVLIVTEPSVSAFHDLKRIVDLTKNFKVKRYVVINKYDISIALSNRIEAWCVEQQIPLVSKLPFDKELVEAMIQCKSIVEFNPLSEYSSKMQVVFNALLKDE